MQKSHRSVLSIYCMRMRRNFIAALYSARSGRESGIASLWSGAPLWHASRHSTGASERPRRSPVTPPSSVDVPEPESVGRSRGGGPAPPGRCWLASSAAPWGVGAGAIIGPPIQKSQSVWVIPVETLSYKTPVFPTVLYSIIKAIHWR